MGWRAEGGSFMKRVLAAVAAAVLVLPACGSGTDDDAGSGATKAADGAQTYEVTVDTGGGPDFRMTAFAYFPSTLTAHPGDTVEFKLDDTGEPHTVTFGTLVDAGLTKAKAAGPDAKDSPAELESIPDLLPEGPGDALQGAANPCFLKTGAPPKVAAQACPKVEQPEFDGSFSIFSSGWIGEDEFRMKLAEGLKPGTYQYFCELHREAMTGSVKVVDKATPAQSPDEVEKAAEAQRQKLVEALRPVYAQMQKATPAKAAAGGGAKGVEGALVIEFGPTEAKIAAGQSVTWTVFGPHSIGFNLAEDQKTFRIVAPDGTIHANQKNGPPVNSPGQTPPSGEPKPGTTLINGGTWDGTGAKSSGLIVSFPPAFTAYKITFTKAGTYKYACQVHPKMEGTVTVT